jgi:phosphatidylinositol 4-kinase A
VYKCTLKTQPPDSSSHLDPFYVRQEFAPSDKLATMKRQQQAYNAIAPHFRLLQFLSSHFNATRLSNSNVEKVYHRLMHITLDAMGLCIGHPLAREAHFHVILLGLKSLHHCTSLRDLVKWRLKDRILSAGLAWFVVSPKWVKLLSILINVNDSFRWSFGGNRLQIKAETHVLSDIQVYLRMVTNIGAGTEGSLKSLQGKQDLFSLLLANEQTRLMVWLFPLDYEKKHHFISGQHIRTLTEVCIHLSQSVRYHPCLLTHSECNPRLPKNCLDRESCTCCPPRTTLPVPEISQRYTVATT